MKKLHAAALALVAMLALGAALAEMPDKEALASVNGKTITAGDLKRYMALQPQQISPPAGSPMTETELASTLARHSLDALIERDLLLAPARDDFGQTDSAKAALNAYADRQVKDLEDRAGSRLRAVQTLSDQGLTLEQYRQSEIDSALIGRFLYTKVLKDVAVTPGELREYYKAHPDEFRRPRTLLYRQILITVSDPQQQAARLALAQQVLKQLRAGGDFARLADQHSADRDAYPGGLHAVEVPEGNADWRPPVLAGLAAGQISDVQQVGDSFAIAKFESVQEPRQLSFEEVQDRLSQQLLERKRTAAQAAYVEDLKRKARIQYLPGAQEFGERP
jgi:parvulin-like peptidyl-prolyl isomerase